MEFKGTKGKWYTIQDENNILVTCDNPNWHICETHSVYEIDKANALLISKAPEMLDMLIELEMIMDKDLNPTEMHSKIQDLIKQSTEL